MWLVEFENPRVQAEVEDLIRSGRLSREDQVIIHAWIRQVAHYGPESIRGEFKWADHALTGDWRGYRASAFSNSGRIIYRIVEKKVLIAIARITSNHDYRKGSKR